MGLLSAAILEAAIQDCKYALDNIGGILENGGVCEKQAFMQAAEAMDADQVNGYLEEAIKQFTGQENVVYGLNVYCVKFGIPVTQTGADAKDILLWISEHANAIGEKLPAISQ